MKKTLNLLCSLLLITSFYFCKASWLNDEEIKRLTDAGVELTTTHYKPRELPKYPELPGEIELINGAKVPKKYERIIEKLFTQNSIFKPGHCIFPVLRALKEKYESNNDQFTALEESDARLYDLHPKENVHAYKILNAIFNTYPSLRLDPNEYIKSEDFTSEHWQSLGISFPIKDLKKD